jgi:hypothetical protein
MAQNVTISMVAQHAKRHEQTVRRVFRTAGVETFRNPGVRHTLARLSDVNKFLRESWPHIGEMKVGE